MARHRTPSRRTVFATGVVGVLVATAFLLAPRNGGANSSLSLVLVRPDGSAGPSARFDAETLRRLRSPVAAAATGAPAEPDSVAALDSLATPVGAGPPTGAGAPGGDLDAAPGASGGEETATPEPTAAPEPPTLRIPLVLAVEAEQGDAPAIRSLRLGVPAPFLLVGARADSAGRSAAPGWGEPVRYYDIALAEAEPSEAPDREEGAPDAGRGPRVLRHSVSSPDTLWLEYDARDLACGLDADSVPRFRTTSPPQAGALRDVRLAYALSDRRGALHTGVLRLEVDAPAPEAPEIVFTPSDGAIRMRPGGLPPADTLLRPRLTYGAHCEDEVESHPLTVRFLMSDAGPGRAYLVGVGDRRPRLRLEDTDGDDILDAETWDPDGDGRFEATRAIRLPLPDALRSDEWAAFLRAERQAIEARLEAEAARRRALRAARPDTAAPRPPPPQPGDSADGGRR